jgi:hypothetical protein
VGEAGSGGTLAPSFPLGGGWPRVRRNRRAGGLSAGARRGGAAASAPSPSRRPLGAAPRRRRGRGAASARHGPRQGKRAAGVGYGAAAAAAAAAGHRGQWSEAGVCPFPPPGAAATLHAPTPRPDAVTAGGRPSPPGRAPPLVGHQWGPTPAPTAAARPQRPRLPRPERGRRSRPPSGHPPFRISSKLGLSALNKHTAETRDARD